MEIVICFYFTFKSAIRPLNIKTKIPTYRYVCEISFVSHTIQTLNILKNINYIIGHIPLLFRSNLLLVTVVKRKSVNFAKYI